MHYLDASFKKTADTAEWAILGDDIEEMSVELNANSPVLNVTVTYIV